MLDRNSAPLPTERGIAFRHMSVLWPNGRPVPQLLSSCYKPLNAYIPYVWVILRRLIESSDVKIGQGLVLTIHCKILNTVLYSFNLNVAIHCFGTILEAEGLEKRLGLGLARSRSRSRLVAKIRRLGLVSVS